jgi:uncharacterized membrane protein
MKEFIESLRSTLNICGELSEVVLNALSLLAIAIGVILSLAKSIKERGLMPGDHPLHTYFRKIFGGWLIVALEFQLAADIAGTIISPTTAHLIELGAIALIRTFLNYFLGKELEEEKLPVVSTKEKKKEVVSEKLIVS